MKKSSDIINFIFAVAEVVVVASAVSKFVKKAKKHGVVNALKKQFGF